MSRNLKLTIAAIFLLLTVTMVVKEAALDDPLEFDFFQVQVGGSDRRLFKVRVRNASRYPIIFQSMTIHGMDDMGLHDGWANPPHVANGALLLPGKSFITYSSGMSNSQEGPLHVRYYSYSWATQNRVRLMGAEFWLLTHLPSTFDRYLRSVDFQNTTHALYEHPIQVSQIGTSTITPDLPPAQRHHPPP